MLIKCITIVAHVLLPIETHQRAVQPMLPCAQRCQSHALSPALCSPGSSCQHHSWSCCPVPMEGGWGTAPWDLSGCNVSKAACCETQQSSRSQWLLGLAGYGTLCRLQWSDGHRVSMQLLLGMERAVAKGLQPC